MSGDSGLNDIRDLAEKLRSPFQRGDVDSRLRGNDEGKSGKDEGKSGKDEEKDRRDEVKDVIASAAKQSSAAVEDGRWTATASGLAETSDINSDLAKSNNLTSDLADKSVIASAAKQSSAAVEGGRWTATASGLAETSDMNSGLAEKSEINSGITETSDVHSGLTETNDSESVFSATPFAEKFSQQSILEPYVQHLLTYIEPAKLKPLKLVVNAGNGAAGHVIDAIEERFAKLNVPVEFIKVHHEADGDFPNGIPNPLLPENRAATADAVIAHQADMGIAWDGDFDRCFLFDENGRFIEGYYIVGLLAEAFLRKHAGEKIIHDPRLTWNTIDQVLQAGGVPIQSKTGHAFIKERMRKENAIYGGEMSAHHYFRDFAYCDSGMIPWLLVSELLSVSGQTLSSLVDQRMAAYPCSGEINYRVSDAKLTLNKITEHFSAQAPVMDTTDGVSLEFEQWRFNLRMSNTEPLLRLNVESRGDAELVWQKVAEIETIIQSAG
ncbi:phosphomannomutase CpsG [Methylophaga lonarensis]|uniref:phosphomannomutase CpsG n=1 Tax=Methylophaga lonarensis TaxID=999151 RepID=UPI003D2E2B07